MNKSKQKSTESTEDTFKSGLSPLQEKAAIMLANGDSVTLVAESLNVNRTTIYQWQQKVTFQCFFNIQKKEATQNLHNGLVALYQDALQAVKDVLKSDNETMKLKAAMLVIAKVESTPVGATDAKAVLRKQATEVQDPLNNDVLFKPIEILDNRQYQQLLAENGLDD